MIHANPRTHPSTRFEDQTPHDDNGMQDNCDSRALGERSIGVDPVGEPFGDERGPLGPRCTCEVACGAQRQ
jgi:hypothetical protein